MTDYAPSLVVLLGVTALKQPQVSVVGSQSSHMEEMSRLGVNQAELRHELDRDC